MCGLLHISWVNTVVGLLIGLSLGCIDQILVYDVALFRSSCNLSKYMLWHIALHYGDIVRRLAMGPKV